MNILLEMRWIRRSDMDGITRFTLSIVSELLRRANRHHYILLFHRAEMADFCMDWIKKYNDEPLSSDYEFFVSNLPVTSWRNHLQLPGILKRLQPDLFFSPYFMFYAIRYPCFKIATVHDLIPLKFPQVARAAGWAFRTVMTSRRLLKRFLKTCDRIVTVSESSHHDLVDMLDIPPQKIDVISLGVNLVNPQFHAEEVLVKHHLLPEKKYILCVGRQEPYKNFFQLLKVFSQLSKHLQTQHPLLIVGARHPHYTPQLEKEISRLGLDENVILTGAIPSDELATIYQQSIVFIYLSLYEGFGLPVLEAMSHGVPVIASNLSSLPEVVGEAGILLDPRNTAMIVTQLRLLLDDQQEQKRLSMAGLVRASQFTWDKTTDSILQVFDRCAHAALG